MFYARNCSMWEPTFPPGPGILPLVLVIVRNAVVVSLETVNWHSTGFVIDLIILDGNLRLRMVLYRLLVTTCMPEKASSDILDAGLIPTQWGFSGPYPSILEYATRVCLSAGVARGPKEFRVWSRTWTYSTLVLHPLLRVARVIESPTQTDIFSTNFFA